MEGPTTNTAPPSPQGHEGWIVRAYTRSLATVLLVSLTLGGCGKPSKAPSYISLKTEERITLISKHECEFTTHGGETYLGKYTKSGDQLRAVVNISGATRVLNLRATEKGLVDDGGDIYVSPEAFVSAYKTQNDSINCANNLKIIGLSMKQYALDRDDNYPWNVSVKRGGTKELAVGGADTIESNPIHFEVISNELGKAKWLHCPADKNKTPSDTFQNLSEAHVTYLVHTGTNVTDTTPEQIMVECPIHGHILLCDGAVQIHSSRANGARSESQNPK